jgi:hypothetical protein
MRSGLAAGCVEERSLDVARGVDRLMAEHSGGANEPRFRGPEPPVPNRVDQAASQRLGG